MHMDPACRRLPAARCRRAARCSAVLKGRRTERDAERRHSLYGVLAVVLLLSVVRSIRAESDGGPLQVVLAPSYAMTTGDIRLADVADIQGADLQQVQRLRQVDLLSAAETPHVSCLSRRYIALRLQLAGYSSGDYVLSGAEQVRLEPRQPLLWTDAEIERLARQELARQLGIPAEELRVTLNAPLMEHLSGIASWPPDALVDVVIRGQPTLGQTTLLVRVLVNDRIAAVRTAHCDVAREALVLVACEPLPRGRVLTADLCRQERRTVHQSVETLSLEAVVGRTLAAPVSGGGLIEARHLQPPAEPSEQQAVRARDAVRVTARGRGLVVTLRHAEALQSGRIGQMIRVRNLETNHVLVARVVSPGEVEVSCE